MNSLDLTIDKISGFDRLQKVREYAIKIIDADDMTKWASHDGYAHGVDILKIVDQVGEDAVWDSRIHEWKYYKGGLK